MFVNSCPAMRPAARVDDGGEIVGAEIPLHELPEESLDSRRAGEARVQIVEDDHVDAAFRHGVSLHVRLDRLAEEERTGRTFDRQIDQRKRRDLLRPAVLEHLEVVLRQISDEALPCASVTTASTST